MMNNKDNKNEEVVEIKKLDLDSLNKISGGYYGSDWKKEAQERYLSVGIIHTKNKFSRDKYAIKGVNGHSDVPISKSLAKKFLGSNILDKTIQLMSEPDSLFELLSAFSKAGYCGEDDELK